MLKKLTDYGIIEIRGLDAAKFLQGQLTCDVNQYPAQLAAHCNAQGRVISLFYLLRQDAAFYILLPKPMLAIAMSALKKYAVFFKVKLTDVSTEQAVLVGQVQDAEAYLLPNTTYAVTLAEHVAMEEISLAAWKKITIPALFPMIYPETSSFFLPHELNLPELNAVSFAKGCFTGQEIIARMQYRGKLKKHIIYAVIADNATLTPGTDVYVLQNGNPIPVGIIIDSSLLNDQQTQALLLIDDNYVQAQHVFLKEKPAIYFDFTKHEIIHE